MHYSTSKGSIRLCGKRFSSSHSTSIQHPTLHLPSRTVTPTTIQSKSVSIPVIKRHHAPYCELHRFYSPSSTQAHSVKHKSNFFSRRAGAGTCIASLILTAAATFSTIIPATPIHSQSSVDLQSESDNKIKSTTPIISLEQQHSQPHPEHPQETPSRMYILHTFSDRFAIDIEHSNVCILIDRDTGNITKSTAVGSSVDTAFSQRIYGIVGVITLLRGKYLIAITDSRSIGSIQGNDIRLLTDATIIAYNPDTPLSAQESRDEEMYLSLIRRVLLSCNFYFSYDYDLTLSTQYIAQLATGEYDHSTGISAASVSASTESNAKTTDKGSKSTNIHTARLDPGHPSEPSNVGDLSMSEQATYTPGHYKRADLRFFWNRYMSSDLIDAHADEWILPLMNGYISTTTLDMNHKRLEFILISRRSWERTGRRFITRGVDLNGKASNYAETEQILYVHPPYSSYQQNNKQNGANKSNNANAIKVASYVQIRGSIPLLWQQPATLKYAPKIQILSHDGSNESRDAFNKHFEFQISRYGKVTCVNLVNQRGAELQLMRGFSKAVNHADNPNIRLVNWDFHHECKNMKYENIEKLFKIIADDIQKAGYFVANITQKINRGGAGGGSNAASSYSFVNLWQHVPNGQLFDDRYEWHIENIQRGVIRTNCVDCLDRTNVVQSVFAGKQLDKQLVELGVITDQKQKPASFSQLFRDVWANNADGMSVAYSGTGALKTDYTRTGKRSFRGALQDGVNSLTRYYLNNFVDGTIQDSLDLFVGYYRPTKKQPSPYDSKLKQNKRSQQSSLFAFLLRFAAALFTVYIALTTLMPAGMVPFKRWGHTTQFFILSTVFAIGSWKLSIRYGRRFVNRPKLINHIVEDIIYTDKSMPSKDTL